MLERTANAATRGNEGEHLPSKSVEATPRCFGEIRAREIQQPVELIFGSATYPHRRPFRRSDRLPTRYHG